MYSKNELPVRRNVRVLVGSRLNTDRKQCFSRTLCCKYSAVMYCDFITIIIICFSRSPCMVRINKVNGKGDVGGVRAVKTLPYLVEHGLRTHHNNGRRRKSKRSYFNVGKHTLKNTNISTVKPMFYPQNTHTHTYT